VLTFVAGANGSGTRNISSIGRRSCCHSLVL
jgi:hypothetical protein